MLYILKQEKSTFALFYTLKLTFKMIIWKLTFCWLLWIKSWLFVDFSVTLEWLRKSRRSQEKSTKSQRSAPENLKNTSCLKTCFWHNFMKIEKKTFFFEVFFCADVIVIYGKTSCNIAFEHNAFLRFSGDFRLPCMAAHRQVIHWLCSTS